MASHSKKGLKNRARIAFLDESGISERPSVRRTWAPRGKTPVITSTGSWSVRSVIGVITCTPRGEDPRFFLRIFHGTVHKEEELMFLKEFRRYERGVGSYYFGIVWERTKRPWCKSISHPLLGFPPNTSHRMPQSSIPWNMSGRLPKITIWQISIQRGFPNLTAAYAL